jgi:hypothetical protein
MSEPDLTPEFILDLRSLPKRHRAQVRAELEKKEGGRIRRQAEAVGRLDAAWQIYEAGQRNLEQAILSAREAGVTLEEIAGVVGWSKEKVRRVTHKARADGEAQA